MQGIGRIPVRINGGVCVGVTDVDVSAPRNVKQSVTADGKVITTAGVPKPKFSLKGVLLEGEQKFFAAYNAAKAAGQTVNLSYRLGSEEWLLLNCTGDNDQVTSNSDGEGTFTLSGVADERIRVS